MLVYRKVLDEVDVVDGVILPVLVLWHWLLVEFRGHLLPFSRRYSIRHHGEPLLESVG